MGPPVPTDKHRVFYLQLIASSIERRNGMGMDTSFRKYNYQTRYMMWNHKCRGIFAFRDQEELSTPFHCEEFYLIK